VEGRPFVTVVSGLPRSGTSMAMQMLVAGGLAPMTDEARRADESNPRGYLELEAVKRTGRDAGWVSEAGGKAVKVVHALLGSLPAGPAYRVVLMRRPMGQVLASQGAMLARWGGAGAGLPADRLAAVYEGQLRQAVEAVRTREGFSLLEVSYEAVLADPRREAERVAAFLDGRVDPAGMAGAVDRGLRRQRG